MKSRKLAVSLLVLLGLAGAPAALADGVTTKPMPEPTVNINEADAATLAAVLDGVGLKRAEAIVLYREKNGKFYSAEELTAVQGIGESTVVRNEARIKVD